MKNQILFKNMNSVCCENKKIKLLFKNMNSICCHNKKSNHF